MRYWISMYGQFFTEDLTIRIIGEDGKELFPLIEKDDLSGEFDFKAAVYPSISGKNDIDKKQGMDLFQLLVNLPFVDQQKLTSKVLHSWNWNLGSVAKKDEVQPPMGMPGQEGMMPGQEGMMPGQEGMMPQDPGALGEMPPVRGGEVPDDVVQAALSMLGGTPPYQEASSPINLLQTQGQMPPTAPDTATTNPRGLNRGGKVNTNIASREYPIEGNIANQANNLQS